jgi:phospholipid-binding lipoprotein MlaA
MKAPQLMLLALIVSMAGCARLPSPDDAAYRYDRFERFNRKSDAFNMKLDKAVKPVARTYGRLPVKVRRSVSRFFTNLRGPIDITNNLLQGKFKCGFSGVGRLLVNSTIGLGGFLDPASRWGMPRYAEDFGQTLGRWGVPAGPYLVLPVFGSSSARDAAGLLVDWQQHPRSRLDDFGDRAGLFALERVDDRSEFLTVEEDSAADRQMWDSDYGYWRYQYMQRRRQEVDDDGEPPGDADPGDSGGFEEFSTDKRGSRCSGE